MTTPLTIGGICAGYGGLEMAAALALGPLQPAWHAEIDPDASRLLAARWPDVPNHGDLTAVDWRAVEPVDVLAAGFPCQTVSVAGKRKGDGDQRWLWEQPADTPGETVGVITAIRTLRPATVVIENVANLVSFQRGRLFRAVLDDLRAAGYAVRYAVAGACTAGACHHRHRVFILARLVDGIPPPPICVDMPTCANTMPMFPTPTATRYGNNQSPSAGAAVRPSLDSITQLLPTPNAALGRGCGTPSPQTAAERMAGGRRFLDDAVALLPTPRVSATRTGRSAVLGSSSAPSLEQALEIARGELPRELESWEEAPPAWQPFPTPTPTARDARRGRWGDGPGRPLSEAVALLPTPRATDGTKGGPNMRGSSGDLMLPSAVQPERWGQYAAAVARWAGVHGAPPEPVEPNHRGDGWRLSAAFAEWMMGLPAGWVTDLCGRNASLRLIGNGVMPHHGGRVLGLLADDEREPADLFGMLDQ